MSLSTLMKCRGGGGGGGAAHRSTVSDFADFVAEQGLMDLSLA
jgi:hypothetical protein